MRVSSLLEDITARTTCDLELLLVALVRRTVVFVTMTVFLTRVDQEFVERLGLRTAAFLNTAFPTSFALRVMFLRYLLVILLATTAEDPDLGLLVDVRGLFVPVPVPVNLSGASDEFLRRHDVSAHTTNRYYFLSKKFLCTIRKVVLEKNRRGIVKFLKYLT